MKPNIVNSKTIANLISEDAFSGHGIVPFVGSGLSAASGILMGQEFGNFLAYSIYRVVSEKHNLARDGWPKYPRDEEVDTVREWVESEFTKICTKLDCRPNHDEEKRVQAIEFSDASNSTTRQLWSLQRPLIPLIIRSHKDSTWRVETQTRKFQEQFRGKVEWGIHAESGAFSRTSNQFVVERAIRSMHDWRSMLQLLAQLESQSDGSIVLKDEVDASVIDSFNVHITRDRQINLGHKMLAHLAGPLRIRTVLTTNFDNLIETAFRRLLRPLSIVSVSGKGELPNPKTVRSKETIVKLHGELSETRADFTLDEEPSAKDKETFAQYIRGEFDASTETHAIANHMLVLGFSGQDIRIIQMLKYTLDTRPRAKIYWICHGKHEPDRIYKLFGAEYAKRVIIHQTERPDLFLYELYQHVTLNLPSGGFSYEFTHKVPPESIHKQDEKEYTLDQEIETGVTPQTDPRYGLPPEVIARKSKRDKIAKKVGEKIFEFIQNPERNPNCFVYPTKNPIARVDAKWRKGPMGKRSAQIKLYTSSGSASAMRVAFQELLAARTHCLWLEMQDYPTPEDLLQDILRIIALRVGSYQLEHVVLYPGTNKKSAIIRHIKKLLQFLGVSKGKWTLFFYGRSVPGAASGWNNKPWTHDQLKQFLKFVSFLGRCGFHTVYAPMTLKRFKQEQDKVKTDPDRVIDALNLMPSEDTPASFEKRFAEAHELKDEVDGDHAEDIKNQLIDSKQPKLESAKHLGLYQSLQGEVVSRWLKPSSSATDLPEARALARRYFRKLRFLYASTLFRQSRHTSAFFSDAVFPCPHKFNAQGLDNDWERSLEVARWVDQLGSIDVFFYKPGGYSWKYRDMRIGLQNKLEAIPFCRVMNSMFRKIYERVDVDEKQLEAEIKNVEPLSYAIQIRSRSHYEIAAWYWKAFNATGHYLPFIESLYHHFECLNFIDFARPISIQFDQSPTPPIDVVNYQRNLARTCVLGMIKALKTAKPWLKFWLAGVNGHTMFDFKSFNAWFEEKIKAIVDSKKNAVWVNELQDAKHMLESEMASIQSSLMSEAGNYVPKPYDREFVPDIRSDYFSSKYSELEEKPPLTMASDFSVWRSDFAKGFKQWLCQEPYATFFQMKDRPLKEIYEAIMDFYEDGDENNTHRALGRLKSLWVSENLRTIECAVCSQTLQEGQECSNRTCQENPRVKYGFDNSAAIFTVDLFSDLAYLLVKRAKMEKAAYPCKRENFRRWLQVTMVCAVALDLCKHIHPAYLSTERKQQIKLQTLYGLALAHLGRPLEANRRFNEASAILSKESKTPDEVETAIIRLRRAEATLLRSELIGDVIDSLPKLAPEGTLDPSSSRNNPNSDRPTMACHEGSTDWAEETGKLDIPKFIAATEANLKARRGYAVSLGPSNPSERDMFFADPVVRRVIANWHSSCSNIPIQEAASNLSLKLSRMQSAFLDDAWVYLESSERLLAGYSQSSLWWGRVAALKLRAYALVRTDAKYESLVFRRRIQHDTAITALGDRLLLIAPTSNFAMMKSVELQSNSMCAMLRQNFIGTTLFPTNAWRNLVKLLTRSLVGFFRQWSASFENGDQELPLLLLKMWLNAYNNLADVVERFKLDIPGLNSTVPPELTEAFRKFLRGENLKTDLEQDVEKYVSHISPGMPEQLQSIDLDEIAIDCLQRGFLARRGSKVPDSEC